MQMQFCVITVQICVITVQICVISANFCVITFGREPSREKQIWRPRLGKLMQGTFR